MGTTIGTINEPQVGLVFVLPHKKAGRRKSFGTVALIEGHQVMCLGYTPDGSHVVYGKLTQLKRIGKMAMQKEKTLSYRILKWLMSRYGVEEDLPIRAQGSGYWAGGNPARGAHARRKDVAAGPIGSIVPKSLPGV